MSEHKAYNRELLSKWFDDQFAVSEYKPRGRFRPDANGDDIILPLYRTYPTAARYVPNAVTAKGKIVPRVNEAKRAIREAQQKGTRA